MQDETIFGKGCKDLREDFFKDGAWRHEEIAGAMAPAPWIEKNPLGGFATYPKRNQGQQSDCVEYSLAKQLAVDNLNQNGVYRELSPRSIYPYVVQSGGGSSSIDATKLAVTRGMTLESLLPTDGLSEADAEKDNGFFTDAKLIAKLYAPVSFVESATDFETIASILYGFQQQNIKKVITITVEGINNGTWLSNFPAPPKPTDTELWYHRVSVTDFGIINGQKYLAIDNSWGANIGNAGQQFLSTAYEQSMYGGIYTIPQANPSSISTVIPPKYTWNVDISTGASGPDVLALQTALQSIGMFPASSIIKPTGAFYGVTQNAVKLFQASFGLPITGIADASTRDKLNDIFGA